MLWLSGVEHRLLLRWSLNYETTIQQTENLLIFTANFGHNIASRFGVAMIKSDLTLIVVTFALRVPKGKGTAVCPRNFSTYNDVNLQHTSFMVCPIRARMHCRTAS